MSAWPEKRGLIKTMMEMAAKDIEKLGGTVEMVDIGKQTVRLMLMCWVSFFNMISLLLLLLLLKR